MNRYQLEGLVLEHGVFHLLRQGRDIEANNGVPFYGWIFRSLRDGEPRTHFGRWH